MVLRDILILMLCCVAWAGNFLIIAWAAGANDVPPLFMAAVRAGFVVVLMSPFLFRARPDMFGRMLLVTVFIGPLHLAFLYTGLQTASGAGGAIVSQMLIPLATLLSIVFLKERIGWRRTLAIGGAFAGTMVMLWEPGALSLDIGLSLILVAYISLAIGSVVMRTLGELDWRIYVAWMALLVFVVMGAATLAFEADHVAVVQTKAFPLIASSVYAGLFVSIFAHGQYFRMLTRYPVNDVVPLTLMVPVFAVLLSVVFLREWPSLQAMVGAALILPSVYVIARRGTGAVEHE